MNPPKVKKTNLKELVRNNLDEYIKELLKSSQNKLPREEELAQMLGVSRITLRSVLDDMASEGIIVRKHGHGTFINEVYFQMKVSLNPASHYSDMITNSGYSPSTRIVESGVIPADSEAAQALDIAEGDDVIFCTKFFFANNTICSMVKDYIPLAYVGTFDRDLFYQYDDSIFYYYYHVTQRKIVSDKIEIHAAYSADIAELHEEITKNHGHDKPFLLLNIVNYDDNNQIALYSREYIDTDIITFNQLRKKNIAY